MADPVFLLQLIEPRTGDVVRMSAGPLELDFITACATAINARLLNVSDPAIELALRTGLEDTIARCERAIVARGVGLGHTEAHVAQDIRDGLREVLTAQSFGRTSLAASGSEAQAAMVLGISDVFSSLKKHTRGLV